MPQKTTRRVAGVVDVVGIIANFVAIPFLSDIAFWLVVEAFGVLALATYLKGI